MRTLSLKARVMFACGLLRGCVYHLHTNAYLPAFITESLVTKCSPLPIFADKPASCGT